jgi:hypothetical protein
MLKTKRSDGKLRSAISTGPIGVRTVILRGTLRRTTDIRKEAGAAITVGTLARAIQL